jgi:transglutaminase-like putative cysteine protease
MAESLTLNTPLFLMNYMNNFRPAILFLFSALFLSAQSPLELMEQYKGEEIVRLKNHTQTALLLKDGKILIRERNHLETFLNDKEMNGMSAVSLQYEPPFSLITDIDAYTLVPDLEKNKYKKTKIGSITDRKLIDESVFHDGTRAKSFDFEGVMAGAITVLEYEEEFNEPFLVGREVFDPSFLSESQEFTLTVDKNIAVVFSYFNCDVDYFEHWTEEKRGNVIYHWKKTNIEERKSEGGSPGGLHLSPHIVYRITSYIGDSGETHKVLGNVSDLHQYYQRFLDSLEDPTNELIAITDSLIMGLSDPYQKAKTIYNWVSESIRYIAFEDGYGGFRPREANFVCSKRYGDCKDMSNLMVKMMNYAGLEAYHVWIGTRRIPYTYEQVPSGLSDNHMIAAWKHEGEYYLLDATNKFLPFPYPSSFIQGKQALINISAEEFRLQKVAQIDAEQNYEIDSLFLSLEGSKLRGEGTKSFGIYNRSDVLRVLERKDEEALSNYIDNSLEKGSNRCKSVFKSYTDTDTGLVLNYQMTVKDYARLIGEKTIINLNLEPILASESLDDDRINPLEIEHTNKMVRFFSLAIPETLRVSHLPESDSFQNEKFSYDLQYSVVGQQIHYRLEIKTMTLQLDPEDFEAWNDMVKSLRRNYQKTIILIPDETL